MELSQPQANLGIWWYMSLLPLLGCNLGPLAFTALLCFSTYVYFHCGIHRMVIVVCKAGYCWLGIWSISWVLKGIWGICAGETLCRNEPLNPLELVADLLWHRVVLFQHLPALSTYSLIASSQAYTPRLAKYWICRVHVKGSKRVVL